MRELRAFLLRAFSIGAALAVGSTGPASASILTLTGGSLEISIGPLPALGLLLNAPGTPIAVSSGAGGFTEPGGIFAGTASATSGFPILIGPYPASAFTIANVSNGAKSIGASGPAGPRTAGILRAGGGLGGPGPLAGTAIVNFLGLFNLSIPLEPVGNTGADLATLRGTIHLTVQGTGWTTGPVMLTGVGSTTSPPGTTITFAGFDNRTPGHAGVMQLISPFKVITGIGFPGLAGLAVQTLTFSGVPEPGTLGLVGAGVAGLLLHGWRRLRR